MNSIGQTIFRSGGYTRKFMCVKGIESVRRNSKDD
ncbi:YegP family protein [Flavobacterium collinsii]|nr:YegP family protein [Flavobacterium collinsii]